jgi:Family of unknown function (DUF5335)
MAESTALPPQGTTQTIKKDRWIPFLAEFTREYRGAHGELEVIGIEEIGYDVETEDKPFDGVAADVKDRESAVWIMFGLKPEDRLTHGIQNVTAIRVLPPSTRRGGVLEVEAKDGTRTVLTLSRPEEFALPSPESQRH